MEPPSVVRSVSLRKVAAYSPASKRNSMSFNPLMGRASGPSWGPVQNYNSAPRTDGLSKLIEEEIQMRKHGAFPKDNLDDQENTLWGNHKEVLVVISQSLASCNQVTTNLIQKLDGFDQRLDNTIDSIKKIQTDIQMYEKKEEDIHKTIELLNGVLHLFNQIGEIESMIGSNDLSEFLMGYDKLKEAITFLEQNSGGVGAAEKLEKCKVAKANLSKKFKDLLEKMSVPQNFEAVVEARSTGEAWPEALEFSPPKVIKEARSLAKRNLKDNAESTILEDYLRLRSVFLSESLLRTFGITMEEVSDEKVAEGDTKESKDKSKARSNITRKLNFQTLVPITNPSTFLNFVEMMMIILRSERMITNTIFFDPEVFPMAFGGELRRIMQLFHEASTFVFKSLHTNPNFLASMTILLNVLSHSKGLISSAAHVLELKRPKEVPPECEHYFLYFQEEFSKHYWKLLKNCLAKVFDNFLVNKTNESLKPLPSDGEVHPLTSTILNFLIHMTKNKSLIHENSLIKIADKYETIANFAVECISKLRANIMSTRKDGVFYTIFELNNYYFIHKRIQESPSLVSEIPSEKLQEYSQWYLEQADIYFQCWEKIISYVIQYIFSDSPSVLGPNFKPSKHWGVTQKPAIQIKERFNTFNTELFEIQKKLFLPDEDLREKMRNEIKTRIVPLYRDCLRKYGNVNFCKPKKKSHYIKYTPETLEAMIMEFFAGHLSSKEKAK